MPTTFTELLPSQKSSEHNAINWVPSEQQACSGLLTIHTIKASVAYLVVEFANGFDGRSFHLAKADEGSDPTSESYDVFCARNSQDHQCSCKGFAYGRGKPCKHILAGLALIENDWLRSELVNAEQDTASTEAPF